MGSYLLKQPNGKFASWSSIVDTFTGAEMTREQAYDRCLDDVGRRDAEQKIQRAERDDNLHPGTAWPTDGLGRWRTALQATVLLRGVRHAREALTEFDMDEAERERWLAEAVAALPPEEVRP